MELLLETRAYKVYGKLYFRIHLPKRLSDSLGLMKGDKLLLEIKEIYRRNKEVTKLNVRQMTIEDKHNAQ